MPQITGRTLAVTALLVVGLTGCTGTTDPAPAETVTSAETAAPLVAETPDTEPVADSGDEAAYLVAIRESLPPTTIIPNATDEQLVTAGWEACERHDAGEEWDAISVIEGEERNVGGLYRDSWAIAIAAGDHLC